MGRRLVAAVALAGLVVAGCGGAAPDTTRDRAPDIAPAPVRATTDPGPADPGPAGPAPPAAGRAVARALPVYYVARTRAGYRLQREFHRVTTADPATDAVHEMLADPTGTDPDYRNHWPRGTALRAPVARDGGVTTVDLSGVGEASPGAELAGMVVQQLVFTVQGALGSTDPVRILVDGEPVEQLWGAVATASPVRRGDDHAVRSLVQIDAPADGASVGPEVEVTGEAAVFEGTVLWEVLRGGEVVRSGTTTTAEGRRFAPYAFTVVLETGEYTVRVLEDDPSDGEGRPVLVDDKSITVWP